MSSIIGYYTTPFGELWDRSLYELVAEAIRGVLVETKIGVEQIDAVFFGNMLAGPLDNNLHASAKIAEILGVHVPVFRVESACASGGVAFHLAHNYLKTGSVKTVLVIGAEKMTDYSPEQITKGLASASSGEEQEVGLTFPGLYAMMARHYLTQFNYTEEHLAYVPLKNHFHGSLNEKAQFKRLVTIEQVLNSAYVADPLKVLDCSPISDGAAALVLTTDTTLLKKRKSASVLASETASDSISLKHRRALDEIYSTKLAAQKAFKRSKLKPAHIQVAELHDCFSIAELFAMEALGFWKKGEGGARIAEMETRFGSGGSLVTNTSGGLKAAGHPVGATGVKQIGEIYLQLTNQAKQRQVAASFGLAQNVGGSGGSSVVTILGV